MVKKSSKRKSAFGEGDRLIEEEERDYTMEELINANKNATSGAIRPLDE